MTYSDYDKAWEDHAWEEMRKLLDRELPVRRRRRLAAWWFFGAGLVAGLFLAAVAFFWLSPNDASRPQSEPAPAEPARPAIAGPTGDAPSASSAAPLTILPQAATAAVRRPAPAPTMPAEDDALPAEGATNPLARAAGQGGVVQATLPATSPEPRTRPAQDLPPHLPVQVLAPLASAAPGPTPPVEDAPAASPQWSTSVAASGGSGSMHVLGIGLYRMRQVPGSAWRWGYATGWRVRHSRSSGLAVIAFEEDLQEQTNQLSNKAIAAHFRTWHLAEGALFAERRITPRWALGAEVYTSLLLTTAPTGAGLLQRQLDPSVALDSQPSSPGTQTGSELQALINHSVAPMRLGVGLHLRYTALPRLDLLLRARQQLTDDFPRNGLPDRPFALELGLSVPVNAR